MNVEEYLALEEMADKKISPQSTESAEILGSQRQFR
jgi:hypothetical protein